MLGITIDVVCFYQQHFTICPNMRTSQGVLLSIPSSSCNLWRLGKVCWILPWDRLASLANGQTHIEGKLDLQYLTSNQRWNLEKNYKTLKIMKKILKLFQFWKVQIQTSKSHQWLKNLRWKPRMVWKTRISSFIICLGNKINGNLPKDSLTGK